MTRAYFIKVILLTITLATLQLSSISSYAEDAEKNATQPIYYSFTEPFTINFLRQSNETARYLQIKVAIMSHDQSVIDNAELNLPMLQDALRTLFTIQTLETVSTVEGRKALQQQALDTLKSLLKEETGNDKLDAVYFTSFILQ